VLSFKMVFCVDTQCKGDDERTEELQTGKRNHWNRINGRHKQ